MKLTALHIRLVTVLASVIAFVIIGQQPTFAQSCDDMFQKTIKDVKDAELGQNLETQVLNKINAAAGKYYQATIKQRPYINRDLINAYSLVSTLLAPNLPVAVRSGVQQSIVDLRACVASDRRNFGSITIRVLDFTGQTPVGGSKILINGFGIGVTPASGLLTVPVRAGEVQVGAVLSPVFSKRVTVTVAPGQVMSFDIVLDDSKDLYESSSLILNESSDGVLDANFSAFTLRFFDGINNIALTRLSEVSLIDPADDTSETEQTLYLDSLFTFSPAGLITPTNITTLRNTLSGRIGILKLQVEGEDASGGVHRSAVLFQMGRFQVNVQLLAPPSNPALSRSGIIVKVKSTPGPIIYYLVTNASGSITLPKMPVGVFEVSAETFQGGKYYYAQGIAVVGSNFLINVGLLNTTDRINGVAPFTITPQFADPAVELSSQEELKQRSRAPWTIQPFRDFYPSPGIRNSAIPNEVNVTATASAQGVPVTNSATLSIPQGTQTVTLRYNVQTAEYPFYVLSQSIFNDVWSLSVETQTGQRLYGISRRVNEQVNAQPVWQSNGSTGNKDEIINVASLTTSSAISLSVVASATNVSDSALPTTVQACLGCLPAAIVINKIDPMDPVTRSDGTGNPVKSEFYSIPRFGETNTVSRYFTVQVSKSPGATFQSVRTQIVNRTGAVLMTAFDEPVSGSTNVTVVNDTTLKVKVTLNPTASTITTDPPPTDAISYKIRVTVMNAGQPASDEKDSAARKPLWRMPASILRYGIRDSGGDNWCAMPTYSWLINNSSLYNYIDDVSGEHAQDLDHNTHNTGEDIDTYHPYTASGLPLPPTRGIDYHRQLRAKVLTALSSATDKETVRQWVLFTRTRIDALAGLASVSKLYYSEGEVAPGLTSGWARKLLTMGTVMVNGQLLDLGLTTPTWSNAKLSTNHTHDSHLHITLVRTP